MTKRLIITADDYGMCESVNQGIEECLAANTVSSTCVMTNMEGFPAASTLKARFPRVSIGIHWTITQGRPVSPSTAVHTLVSADGQFLHCGEYRKRWLTGRISATELRRELTAQYERYREVVGTPEFWNTHQHIHMNPGMFQLFVKVAAELKIPAMRCPRYAVHPPLYSATHPLFWLKGRVISAWSRWAANHGMKMPDGRLFIPALRGRIAQFLDIMRDVQWMPSHGIFEFSVHPAVHLETKLFAKMTESRIAEYQFFRRPQLLQEMNQVGLEIVGFDSLTRDG